MKRFLIVVVVVSFAALGYGIYAVNHHVTEVVPNAYAVDWVASMVIQHLKTHDDQWPQSWDDLREPYETMAAPQNYPWSFEELQRRVAVDWTADVEALKTANVRDGKKPFRVIWLADGSESHWQGGEPNQRIFEYLSGIRPAAEFIR